MPCQCQLCPSTDATVHLVELTPAGERTELHICRACIERLELDLEPPPAIAMVLALQAGAAEVEAALSDSDPESGEPQGTPADADTPVAVTACPVCGLAWSAYAQNNLLGCPDCWLAFLEQLDPLIDRYQGAREHHGRRPVGQTGVVAKRTDLRRAKAARRKELQGALAEAVREERFELAASLRDQLKALDEIP